MLGPAGIDVDTFIGRLRPRKVFRMAWFGEDLLAALRAASPLSDSEGAESTALSSAPASAPAKGPRLSPSGLPAGSEDRCLPEDPQQRGEAMSAKPLDTDATPPHKSMEEATPMLQHTTGSMLPAAYNRRPLFPAIRPGKGVQNDVKKPTQFKVGIVKVRRGLTPTTGKGLLGVALHRPLHRKGRKAPRARLGRRADSRDGQQPYSRGLTLAAATSPPSPKLPDSRRA